MHDMEWLRLMGVGPDSTTSLPSMPCCVTPCWHCHSEMAAQAYLVRSKTQINVKQQKLYNTGSLAPICAGTV